MPDPAGWGEGLTDQGYLTLSNVGTGVWPTWVQTATTTNYYPTPPAATTPWSAWIDTGTVSTGVPIQAYQVWVTWNNQPIVNNVVNPYVPAVTPPTPPWTPEEPASRQRQDLIYRTRERARVMRRRVATRKAERLLLEHLTEEQAAEWRDRRYFHVETAGGRRRYRIDRGTAGNVRLVKCEADPLPEGARNRGRIRVGARFCMHVFHPEGPIPAEDNVLAQKLLIESGEQGEHEFLALANVS